MFFLLCFQPLGVLGREIFHRERLFGCARQKNAPAEASASSFESLHPHFRGNDGRRLELQAQSDLDLPRRVGEATVGEGHDTGRGVIAQAGSRARTGLCGAGGVRDGSALRDGVRAGAYALSVKVIEKVERFAEQLQLDLLFNRSAL